MALGAVSVNFHTINVTQVYDTAMYKKITATRYKNIQKYLQECNILYV
jgi:hypothetical protein